MIASGLLLLLGSIAMGGCVATGTIWAMSEWRSISDRQLSEQITRARQLEIDPSAILQFNRWRLPAIIVVLFVFVVLMQNYAIAAALAYLLWIAPVVLMDQLVRKRSILIRDQMVEAAFSLANAVRAGLDLANGLRRVSEDISEPLAGEFRRIVRDIELGSVLRDAVRDAQNRLDLDSFTLFSAAIIAADESGGPINQTLDNIARSLQENQRLERKLEAQTQAGRSVIMTLAIAPLIFLAGSFLVFPEGASLVFSTGLGQLVLFVSFALIMASVKWSKKIMNAVEN